MAEKFRPGQKAPVSGQYRVVGPRGGTTGKEVTVIKGDPLPPARKSGQGYVVSRAGEVRTLKRSVEPSQVQRNEIRSVVRAVHVIPTKDGAWEVKGHSAKNHKFSTKEQAMEYARSSLKRESQVIVHNKMAGNILTERHK